MTFGFRAYTVIWEMCAKRWQKLASPVVFVPITIRRVKYTILTSKSINKAELGLGLRHGIEESGSGQRMFETVSTKYIVLYMAMMTTRGSCH